MQRAEPFCLTSERDVMEPEDRQENSENAMSRGEQTAEEQRSSSRASKLRDLRPEKDPMGAGRPCAQESTR